MWSAADPTGMSSPLGHLVGLAWVVAGLVVALRWWWQRRKR